MAPLMEKGIFLLTLPKLRFTRVIAILFQNSVGFEQITAINVTWMSKLWVSIDWASPTSHGSLRYFSVITPKVDFLGGFPLSFCKPSNSLRKCAFPPWGREGRNMLQTGPFSTSWSGESPGSPAVLPLDRAFLAWHSCPAVPRGNWSYHMPWFLLVQTCILFVVIKQIFNKLEILLLASAHIRCISVLQLFSCHCGFRIGAYRPQLTALP